MPNTELPTIRPGVPSRDGLRLILAGTGYLLVICVLQLIVAFESIGGWAGRLPGGLMDTRDFVALYGWVGLMITGVSVIIVPNHLKVRLRPAYLPKLHLAVANVGLVGFLSVSLLAPESTAYFAFLAVVSGSYVAFGLGVLATVIPFIHSAAAEPARASSGRAASD
ncbi:MAG TPA: hypothetical protein VGS23_08575 [Thermoplasmata archaeon]|nr:hypothetical protein [Thermoplasmata archaeon]